jgi:hypothetical protein
VISVNLMACDPACAMEGDLRRMRGRRRRGAGQRVAGSPPSTRAGVLGLAAIRPLIARGNALISSDAIDAALARVRSGASSIRPVG